MVLCPPGGSHLAGAGDEAERRDDNRKAGLLRDREHWLSPLRKWGAHSPRTGDDANAAVKRGETVRS
jgi:hypothetical protein